MAALLQHAPVARVPVPKLPRATHQPLLWGVKHSPASEQHLVVAPKKLEVLRSWLASQASSPAGARPGRCLLLTGPPGCGKATALRVLAAAAGFRVSEWVPPTLTSWAEATLTGGTYESQLTTFEMWLQRARSVAPLVLEAIEQHRAVPHADSASAAPPPPAHRPPLLVLQDIPLSFGSAAGAKERLLSSLSSLVLCSRFPAVFVLTDADGAEGGRADGRLGTRELVSWLEGRGVERLSLNPVTKAETARLLQRVASAEGKHISAAEAADMADASKGDVRGALATLQMRCAACSSPAPSSAGPARSKPGARGASKTGAPAPGGGGDANAGPPWARSDTLSVFHALGKLLYAKRTVAPPVAPPAAPPAAPPPQLQPFVGDALGAPVHPPDLAQHFLRALPEVADPEEVMESAALSPAGAHAFLHENCLDFIGPDGCDDAAGLCAHLSDSDVLLEAAGPDPLSQLARIAASLVARAVLFHNVHPAPRTFRALRGPQVRASAGGGGVSAAADTLPFLRFLSPGTTAGPASHLAFSRARDLAQASSDTVDDLDNIEEE